MAKRNSIVFNRTQALAGKRLLSWAASGMNWADGPYKADVMSAGRELLARGPVYAAAFAAVAQGLALDALTQSGVSRLVLAGIGLNPSAELRQQADKREEERPCGANWTYDAETDWLLEVAKGCDKVAAL